MLQNRRALEITAFLDHINDLYEEDTLKDREDRVVKIAHAVRKSQEFSPEEKGMVREMLAERRWELLKGIWRRCYPRSEEHGVFAEPQSQGTALLRFSLWELQSQETSSSPRFGAAAALPHHL